MSNDQPTFTRGLGDDQPSVVTLDWEGDEVRWVGVDERWKARVEGMDEMASGFLGGAKNLVDLLKEPTVMGVVLKVIDVVGSVLEKMATADVEDRMKKLKDLGDMATKLQPIESAVTAAGEVSWPTMPTDTEWTPR